MAVSRLVLCAKIREIGFGTFLPLSPAALSRKKSSNKWLSDANGEEKGLMNGNGSQI